MVLSDLTGLWGVSGDEGDVRAFVARHARAACDNVQIDRIGNVLAFQKGTDANARHVLLDAHMDEVGLIVQCIDESGLIGYEPIGGIDPRVMVSKRVLVGRERIPGVIGAKAIHLQSKEERARALAHKDLYVDIGAKDKASCEAHVRPGDTMLFDSEYVEFGEGFIKAKALDDRVGCFNLLRLMQKRYPCDVTYAFTVQEEIGLRGAKVAAWQTRADCALVLEGTAANDLGNIPEHQQITRPGHGVAISFMDRTTIAHPALNRTLARLADERAISWHAKNVAIGGNDAGAIQTARGAIPVCPISVPCRYIHSPSCVCHKADIDAQYQLTEAFLASGAAIDQEERNHA